MNNPAERLMQEMDKTAELIEPISYTSTLRKLRKDNPEKVRPFQAEFKKVFENALDEGDEEPEIIALKSALEIL
jgi:hypothetical protein